MIDCGEGTQIRLREEKISFSRIKHIFISHLHGDHFYGLIGLINTFKLLGRKVDLNIYGPLGIKEIILLQMKLSKSRTEFKLIFFELEKKDPEVIFEDDLVKITTIPLRHRVYTNGFLFEDKLKIKKINYQIANSYKIPKTFYEKLKEGRDYKDVKGNVVKNTLITSNSNNPFSYAYCSDTSFFSKIVDQIKNIDILYHESTFLNEHEFLAIKTLHSTAQQAAKIASLANVDQLILGHFSTRYRNKSRFITEAQKEFKNVILAEQGKKYNF
tara:strand:- start:2952 stop:3764 length:813 start_codon:yes stop_codon:yes gene_type:complete